MLFNSLPFLFLFLPVAVCGALLLRGQMLLAWICLLSVTFYGFAGHAWFLAPMAVTTVLDFAIGNQLEKTTGPKRHFYLVLSLVGNLGLLGYFKYSGLLVDAGSQLVRLFGAPASSRWGSALRVALPAGISFYTFQTMSYVIDIYRRHARAEKNFFAYLAFVSFFPHLVAGPLTRHNQLIPQLRAIAQTGVRPRWWSGVALFSIGLSKKVLVADRIGSLIDPMIGDVRHLGFFVSWVVLLGYAMQIYFDFSGYSDMAIGLGRLFAVELPQNFNSPYRSPNPSEFWRRWHITLSLWLRDYLYISLGGNRRRPARVRLNLLLTMVLGGLWHGASWTFAAWGLYHGLLLVAYQRFQSSWDRLNIGLQRALMFLFVCVGWVFFRAPTLVEAGHWLAGMVGLHGALASEPYAARLALYVGVALVITFFLPNPYEVDLDALPKTRRAVLGLVTAVAVVMMNFSSKFLYFQF
jgi:alginate O-acetyltransferase complex protein AlgI